MPFSLGGGPDFYCGCPDHCRVLGNDTVVIFDRIREYRALHPKMEYAGINQ